MNFKVGISYLKEIAKWAFVLWLFFPLRHSLEVPIDFGRVALGIALFVIFSGKLLYDVVFFRGQHQSESAAGKDLLSMVAIVTGIALLVFLLVFFIALNVVTYMSETIEFR